MHNDPIFVGNITCTLKMYILEQKFSFFDVD